MGAILSLGGLACCCGSAAFSLCSARMPSCKNSTSSRVMYAVLLLATMVVSCVMLAPGLQSSLQSVPFCKGYKSDVTNLVDLVGQGGGVGDYQVDCTKGVGYLAVYRCVFHVHQIIILQF